MPTRTIAVLTNEINEIFDLLDQWCCRQQELLDHVPEEVGWTCRQILEHVGIVNHFLLLTLRKGVLIACRRAKSIPVPSGESNLALLAEISDPNAFDWQPPSHMLPHGIPVEDSRSVLASQFIECIQLLHQMSGGEGFLHTIRMSVRDLGRIDMYQWLYFLLLHARRHLRQMDQTLEIASGAHQDRRS